MKAILFLCATLSTGAIYGMEGKTLYITLTNHHQEAAEITWPLFADGSPINQRDSTIKSNIIIKPNTSEDLPMQPGKNYISFLLPSSDGAFLVKKTLFNLTKEQNKIAIKNYQFVIENSKT